MNNKLKVLELFAGYGGASFSLKKAGVEHEVVGFSEIDKYAIQCYKQNHDGEDLGSVLDIDPNNLGEVDLITGGFPCQSFSIAGKGQGVDDEKGRGLLFNEIIRIAEVKKPKYMLLENVKGLMSKKHKEFFEFTKEELKRIGYNIDVSLYNSKKYGTPQNRERVFYVCIRNDLPFNYIKPREEELKTFLKDVLEDEVDEKYYLSEASFNKHLRHGNLKQNQDISRAIIAGYYKDGKNNQLIFESKPIRILGIYDKPTRIHQAGSVYDVNGISPTLNTMQGGNRQPFIISDYRIRKLTPKECFRLMGFTEDQINLEGLSNTQRYKLAGNGWEINLVSKIMRGFLN